MKASDLISKVQTVKNSDQTYSHKGSPDFEKSPGDVRDLEGRLPGTRMAPSRAKQNNSYT